MKLTLFLVLSLLCAGTSFARRAEPNVFATGYYAVDSDDDAPSPWKVSPYFVDTTYQPSSWIRIQSWPSQSRVVAGYYYFFRPDQTPNVEFDGRDNAAETLPSGVYFGVLHTGAKTATGKFILV